MAGELVSFGIQKLWNLLSQECKQLQGASDQVTKLKSDLNLLKSFLKDADAKKYISAVVKNCVEEIKEVIFDAEDIIETFILRDELGKNGGIKKRIRRLACIIPERREVALEIEGIRKRISKVIRDMQTFGVQQIIADGRDPQLLQERLREMRQEFARDYEINLVGLEVNVKKLVGFLVEEDNVQVISIAGMGGLGKTTLARQVFNHELVKDKFDGLSWVCVSHVFNRKNVWQTIFQHFRPKEEENKILQMTEATLQHELFRWLESSKSLIVLDDIWKEEDWDLIKPIFPPKKGWKVLLTSRNESVAMCRSTLYLNFKPECLTNEDSWTLFQMIALPRKDDAPDFMVDEEMEKLGKQMIKHCGGLPLAVRVLGGLLAAKYTFHDWKRVSENLGSHLVGRTTFNYVNSSSFYHVLALSFEELPCYLKHCFLYLAHFPEDYQISVEKLSYYWAAEGILMYNDGETIRDVGDVYIEELVRRNMVISERDNITSRFETCRFHDMMREICLFKAKEENFLQIDGTRSSTSNSQSRRFVWQYPTTLEVERDINNPKLRSLLIILGYQPKKWMLSGSSFIRLELLRVLDLVGAKFKGGELPSSIGKLIHLRYLSLLMVEVSHIPSSLGNLKLLMYLNINIDMGSTTIFMPNVLMEMQELKYLALPRHMEEKKKLELSSLVKLETLKNFSTENSSLEDLHGMTMLRTLKILVTHETNWETLSASIGGLRYLENLDIKDIWFDRVIEEGFVLDCVSLKHLELSIYMPRLPDEQHLSCHLTTISLHYCLLKEDPMPILEKLLHLKEVYLHWNSFCGKRMVCSSGGFPQLQMLEVVELKELEEWIVEEGSMPLLHTMVINSCYNLEEWIVKQGSMPFLHALQIFYCRKLKELPDGLISVTDLGCYGMGKAWEKRLSEGGKDYSKVQHIPYVRF